MIIDSGVQIWFSSDLVQTIFHDYFEYFMII